MKNFKMLMLAVAGCLSLVSCSDDDENGTVNANADVIGTYRLTAWNAPMAIDFDGNGSPNSNLMSETTCYDNTVMTLNNNGTYTMTYNYVNISGTVSCETETTTGTWTRSGNTVTTTHLMSGQNMNNVYNLSSGSSTTLTRNETNWNYPSIIGGNEVYATGNVSMVMTRQ